MLRKLTSDSTIMEHRGLETCFFSFLFSARAVKMWRKNGKICSHSLRLKLTWLFIRCILCIYIVLKWQWLFFNPLVTSPFLFKWLFTDPSLSQPSYSQNLNKMLHWMLLSLGLQSYTCKQSITYNYWSVCLLLNHSTVQCLGNVPCKDQMSDKAHVRISCSVYISPL